jgi:hypothetical protein
VSDFACFVNDTSDLVDLDVARFIFIRCKQNFIIKYICIV